MAETVTTTKPFNLPGIQAFFRQTYKSRFVRNVVLVASGTAGAQAIAMAFAPVITRLYGPEAFGILGTFMAIVAVVTPVAALTYPVAIVLPKNDSDARGIARLSAYIAIGMATLVAIALLMFGDSIVELLRIQEISSYILLIPLVILFAAWLQINQQWLIRKKQFMVKARVAVVHAFIINGAKSGIGFFRPVAAVLIIVSTIGCALHALLLSIGARKANASFGEPMGSQKTPIWEQAKNHYDFPVYRAPQVLINAVSQSLPILMLAAFFGPASAGFYTLCRKLLGMPSTLIGSSVKDVFYPRIAEAAHRGEYLTRLIVKATLSIAAVGVVPFGLVFVFGPWLFGIVFGVEWVAAGDYARWSALLAFFALINRPSVASIPVLKLQGFFLVYEIASIVLRLFFLFIGFYLLNNDVAAVMLFSLAGVVINIALILVSVFVSHYSYQKRKIAS